MKLLITLLYIFTYSFSGKIYTMTKEEFAKQFNENSSLQMVSCKNPKGEKVLLRCFENTILSLQLKNNKTENLILHTIKFKQNKIEAIRYNVWKSSNKVSSFDFNDVVAISIYNGYETPYFNIDSCQIVVKAKNDSLQNIYSNGTESVIYITNTTDSKTDTFRIIENACYNLTFTNGNQTEFGVVQKITTDTIYISNFFNPRMAMENKKNFELWAQPISQLSEINLLKSHGYSYKTVQLKHCLVSVENKKRNPANCPYWFAMNPTNGAVNLYRLWQTQHKFSAITEIEGKPIWYQGEK